MKSFSKIYKCANRHTIQKLVCNYSTANQLKQISPKPLLRPAKLKVKEENEIGPFGWFLLVVPASTFALGVWQVQRKKWKENLIAELESASKCVPVKLPDNIDEIKKLEYKPVHLRGHFLHDKEMYMGPRSLLTKGDATNEGSLITHGANTKNGYLVITPFKLADRDQTVLVNRGWVPTRYKDPRTREKGQAEGVVDVIGVVRLAENRPNFGMKNQKGSNIWFYRDLETMCAASGAAPIYVDATNDFDVPGGPIGGQTRIALRNEHLSYLVTWFSLCGATSYLWYKKFLKKA